MRTPDLNWIKDPRVFQVNRQHAYSDHIYTIGKDKKPSSFSLNGTFQKIMIHALNSSIIQNLMTPTGTTSKYPDTSNSKDSITPTIQTLPTLGMGMTWQNLDKLIWTKIKSINTVKHLIVHKTLWEINSFYPLKA